MVLIHHSDVILSSQKASFKIHRSPADALFTEELLQKYIVLAFQNNVILSSQRDSFKIDDSLADHPLTAEIRVCSPP